MDFLYTVLGFGILLTVLDINDKIRKLLNKTKQNKLNISEYLNKEVYIILKNENATESYLFNSIVKTIGKILDYDENWFIFRYYDKNIKQNVTQYLRIEDLESINKIK